MKAASKKIIIGISALAAMLFPAKAYMMSSAHYRISADSINIGGAGSSASFHEEDTVGEAATGKSNSATYNMSAGYQAMWDYGPMLSFSINGHAASLGALTTAAAASAKTEFSVSSNADNGYVVEMSGETLTSETSSDNIDALAAPTVSLPGSEQFGINLADNHDPDVGAEPSGGSGAAASDYGTADKFKFVSGDVIAGSSKYSPPTTFTISYLGNISETTASGNYATNITLVATAKF